MGGIITGHLSHDLQYVFCILAAGIVFHRVQECLHIIRKRLAALVARGIALD